MCHPEDRVARAWRAPFEPRCSVRRGQRGDVVAAGGIGVGKLRAEAGHVDDVGRLVVKKKKGQKPPGKTRERTGVFLYWIDAGG